MIRATSSASQSILDFMMEPLMVSQDSQSADAAVMHGIEMSRSESVSSDQLCFVAGRTRHGKLVRQFVAQRDLSEHVWIRRHPFRRVHHLLDIPYQNHGGRAIGYVLYLEKSVFAFFKIFK